MGGKYVVKEIYESWEPRFDPGAKRFGGTTRNVARLALDVSMFVEPLTALHRE